MCTRVILKAKALTKYHYPLEIDFTLEKIVIKVFPNI